MGGRAKKRNVSIPTHWADTGIVCYSRFIEVMAYDLHEVERARMGLHLVCVRGQELSSVSSTSTTMMRQG